MRNNEILDKEIKEPFSMIKKYSITPFFILCPLAILGLTWGLITTIIESGPGMILAPYMFLALIAIFIAFRLDRKAVLHYQRIFVSSIEILIIIFLYFFIFHYI